jgi:hypothetical protein
MGCRKSGQSIENREDGFDGALKAKFRVSFSNWFIG